MAKDKLLVLTFFLVTMGAVLLLSRLPGGADAPADETRAEGLPAAAAQYRGVCLQLQNQWSKHPYEKYITEIREQVDANTICLVLAAYQENCASTSIFIEARRTPSDNRLRHLIRHAQDQGLKVFLMPIVLLENPREGEWRGKINPTSWDDWWEDYGNYVLHYAQIAEQTGCEGMMVGSELVSTESQTTRWKRLIAQVRKQFRGKLSYSANWDHYKPIKWWGELDIIGMTTYYDLTGGDKPTVDRLMRAWKPIKKEILAWQRKINRPILFTEVGWPNQVTCAQYPWDYYRSPNKPDTTAQANCFEAFFRTWRGEKSVAGYLVWEWRSYPQQEIGPKDTSYVPCGKPCLEVIRRYFKAPGPWDEAASRPATAPAGGAAQAARDETPERNEPALPDAGALPEPAPLLNAAEE